MEVCENATAQSLLSSDLETEPRVSLALDKTLLWLQASWDRVMVQLIFPSSIVLALGLFCCPRTHLELETSFC